MIHDRSGDEVSSLCPLCPAPFLTGPRLAPVIEPGYGDGLPKIAPPLSTVNRIMLLRTCILSTGNATRALVYQTVERALRMNRLLHWSSQRSLLRGSERLLDRLLRRKPVQICGAAALLHGCAPDSLRTRS
jgi:hypothetical protein